MTVLGITDEMLEKMGYNQRSVDPGVQKRLEEGVCLEVLRKPNDSVDPHS